MVTHASDIIISWELDILQKNKNNNNLYVNAIQLELRRVLMNLMCLRKYTNQHMTDVMS